MHLWEKLDQEEPRGRIRLEKHQGAPAEALGWGWGPACRGLGSRVGHAVSSGSRCFPRSAAWHLGVGGVGGRVSFLGHRGWALGNKASVGRGSK